MACGFIRLLFYACWIDLVRWLENEFHADDTGPYQRSPTLNSL